MERRPYSRSPLARLRKDAGMTQSDACKLLGVKNKQHLSHIEVGRVMASSGIMKAMATAYGVGPGEVLRAATETFEAGVLLERHRRRQLRVATLRRK